MFRWGRIALAGLAPILAAHVAQEFCRPLYHFDVGFPMKTPADPAPS